MIEIETQKGEKTNDKIYNYIVGPKKQRCGNHNVQDIWYKKQMPTSQESKIIVFKTISLCRSTQHVQHVAQHVASVFLCPGTLVGLRVSSL